MALYCRVLASHSGGLGLIPCFRIEMTLVKSLYSTVHTEYTQRLGDSNQIAMLAKSCSLFPARVALIVRGCQPRLGVPYSQTASAGVLSSVTLSSYEDIKANNVYSTYIIEA